MFLASVISYPMDAVWFSLLSLAVGNEFPPSPDNQHQRVKERAAAIDTAFFEKAKKHGSFQRKNWQKKFVMPSSPQVATLS